MGGDDGDQELVYEYCLDGPCVAPFLRVCPKDAKKYRSDWRKKVMEIETDEDK